MKIKPIKTDSRTKPQTRWLDQCTMQKPYVIFPDDSDKKRVAFDLKSAGGSMTYYVTLTPDNIRELYQTLTESECLS